MVAEVAQVCGYSLNSNNLCSFFFLNSNNQSNIKSIMVAEVAQVCGTFSLFQIIQKNQIIFVFTSNNNQSW